MKQKEVYRELLKAGCFISRHGANHDMWYSPITGLNWPVARHGGKEIPTGTYKKLKQKLLGL